MNKHTPGPWRAVEGVNSWEVWAGDIQVIDFVLEQEDAQLIAAAPDLLGALELAVYEASGEAGNDWYTNALAVIAKARGEA